MTLKHWLFCLVLTLCAALFFGVASSAFSRPAEELSTKESIHWPELLQSHRRLLQSLERSVRHIQESTEAELQLFAERLNEMEQQAAAYQFMLNSYGVSDAFEIMLRCRQVADLHSDSLLLLKQMGDGVAEIRSMLTRLELMRADLEQEEIFVAADLREEMQSNVEEGEILRGELLKLLASLERIRPRVDAVMGRIDELYERSQVERRTVLDEVFFQRGRGYWASLQSLPNYLPQWYVKVSGWLAAQFPTGGFFWMRLGLLLIGLMIPVMWALERFVMPFLHRIKLLRDSRNRDCSFRVAWVLIVITAALGIATNWVGESENGVLTQTAESLGAIAMLLIALVLREGSHDLLPAYRLYLPIVVQHVGGMLLYIALAPYLPLVILVPPFNLLVAVWMGICLWRNHFAWLDVLFGVLSICAGVGATILAAIGLPYLGFTMTLGWLVLVAQFQMVIAITFGIVKFYRNNPQRRLLNTSLLRLVAPAAWAWACLRLVQWTTSTYHLEDYLIEVMDYRFPLPEIVHINLNRVLIAVVVAFLLQFLIRFFKEWIHQSYGEAADFGLVASLLTLGTYLSWTVFALFAMFIGEVDTQSVMVMIGGLCVGLGFALKDVAENFISGVALLIGQEIRPGDVVEVDPESGLLGRVRKVNFRVTTVETEDGAMITYPNAQVMAQQFRNWTRNNPYRRFDILIDVAYETDLALVQRLLMETAQNCPGVQARPAPIVMLSSFEDSSIRFTVAVWVVGVKFRITCSEFRLRVAKALEEHGISIPFPQLDVHNISVPPPDSQPETSGT